MHYSYLWFFLVITNIRNYVEKKNKADTKYNDKIE